MDELEKFLKGRLVGVTGFRFWWIDLEDPDSFEGMSHDEIAVYMGLMAKVQNG